MAIKAKIKFCNRCNEERPFDSHWWCRFCVRTYHLWRRHDKDHSLEYKKRYSYSYRKDNLKIYRDKYREKINARALIKRMLSTGKMVKKPCKECGNKKSQAHHYKGYDRKNWLKIKWLCEFHHNIAEKNY